MSEVIDEKLVRHVAKLARLAVTDADVAKFATQFAQILEYFEQMRQVDTEGVAPRAHPLPLVNVLREDVPRDPPTPGGIAPLDPALPGSVGPCPSWTVEQALANAPDAHDGYFRVPKVLDQETA